MDLGCTPADAVHIPGAEDALDSFLLFDLLAFVALLFIGRLTQVGCRGAMVCGVNGVARTVLTATHLLRFRFVHFVGAVGLHPVLGHVANTLFDLSKVFRIAPPAANSAGLWLILDGLVPEGSSHR